MLEVGTKAPEFTLPDKDGNLVSLTDLAGKKVVLYGCGLRISEALGLTMKNVDLEGGVLTIYNSKFGKNRYVPMSPALTERCRQYVALTRNAK